MTSSSSVIVPTKNVLSLPYHPSPAPPHDDVSLSSAKAELNVAIAFSQFSHPAVVAAAGARSCERISRSQSLSRRHFSSFGQPLSEFLFLGRGEKND